MNHFADLQSFFMQQWRCWSQSMHISDGFCVQIELPVKPDSQVFVCAWETAWFILFDAFPQGWPCCLRYRSCNPSVFLLFALATAFFQSIFSNNSLLFLMFPSCQKSPLNLFSRFIVFNLCFYWAAPILTVVSKEYVAVMKWLKRVEGAVDKERV